MQYLACSCASRDHFLSTIPITDPVAIMAGRQTEMTPVICGDIM